MGHPPSVRCNFVTLSFASAGRRASPSYSNCNLILTEPRQGTTDLFELEYQLSARDELHFVTLRAEHAFGERKAR